MTSMAAALAASLPAAISRQATPQPAAQQPSKVPQRLEGVVDVEAAREVENVSLSSLVSRKVALGFPPIMSALARTARQHGCTSADSWWKIGFPQNDEALYRLFARSARFCPPAR